MNDALQAPAAELAELHADRWTEAFWTAAREHRLVVPRCGRCQRARMPPGPLCRACGEVPISWHPASGRATLHTFTVARQAFHPALSVSLPYAVAVVTLDDHPDVRLVTNIVDAAADQVQIGMPLVVRWHDIDEYTTIPRFAPSTS